MNLQLVVIPPSIYHGCSTRKKFWEGKFTLVEFTATNMRNCGRQNVKKHREIKGSDKYFTFEILFINLKHTCLLHKGFFTVYFGAK